MTSTLSLSGGPKTLFFPFDPNSINWSYDLHTKTTETIGGRVVQVLGCSMKGVSVALEAGNGGEAFLAGLTKDITDLMYWHSTTGKTVLLSYPQRGYSLNVYVTNFSYSNELTSVAWPYKLMMDIDQDINYIVTDKVISAELARLQEGIGYVKNKYNTPELNEDDGQKQLLDQGAIDLAKGIAGILNPDGTSNYVEADPTATGSATAGAWGGYSNGKVPESALKALSWDSKAKLEPGAAASFERLNDAFRAAHGQSLSITESYRDYATQVKYYNNPSLAAAKPGTSNHGWGKAVDVGGCNNFSGFYPWLDEHAPSYGWVNPPGLRKGSSRPEPWHWEVKG